jgi:hypothetical protein
MVNVLSKNQYLKMWNIIGNWQKENLTTRLPNFVIVDGFKIMKSQFMDMWKRVKNYMDNHQGNYPNIVGIEGPAPEILQILLTYQQYSQTPIKQWEEHLIQ